MLIILVIVIVLQVPFCQHDSIVKIVDCDVAVGYMAVYRLCFALCMFFLIMAVIMIGVKSSKDGRAPIQNGLVCDSNDTEICNQFLCLVVI